MSTSRHTHINLPLTIRTTLHSRRIISKEAASNASSSLLCKCKIRLYTCTRTHARTHTHTHTQCYSQRCNVQYPGYNDHHPIKYLKLVSEVLQSKGEYFQGNLTDKRCTHTRKERDMQSTSLSFCNHTLGTNRR